MRLATQSPPAASADPPVPTAPPGGTPAAGGAGRWRGRRRQRMAVVAGALLLVGVLVVARWPSGRFAEDPGPVLDLDSRVTVGATASDTTTVHGSFDGLTVTIGQVTNGGRLWRFLTGNPSRLVPGTSVVPRGADPAAYQAYEKAEFVDGAQISAAVAERALAYEVTTTSDGVEVLGVVPGAPVEGKLAVGDVITVADGKAVTLGADLEHAVAAAGTAPLTLQLTGADGAGRDVVVQPAVRPGSPDPELGVLIASLSPRVDLEVPVTIDSSHVAGPSAGLITALTIYDKLSPEDLARGREIAGTGTLALDGTVGKIGGIEAKARAAEAAGAQLFIAPAAQADAARAVLGDRVPVVGVATFDEALAALRTWQSRS